MTENPYLQLVGEFGDVVSEGDLREFYSNRLTNTMKIFYAWLGFLLTSTIGLIGAGLKFGGTLLWGVFLVLFGGLIVYTSIIGRQLLPSITNENKLYLEAKIKLREKPKL